MNLLLDTATFLWLFLEPENLSKKAAAAITDGGNLLFLSSISTAEIAIKYSLGKLELAKPPSEIVPEIRRLYAIGQLQLADEDALRLELLAVLHRDPFDRLLVCQALERGLTIVTPDSLITQYPVSCLW